MLNEDEEIVFDRNPHWSYMISSISMISLAVFIFVIIAIASLEYAWVGALIVALMVLGSVGRFLRWKTTEFVLTSSRIIVRQGILSKQGIEIPLDRVMNISYKQNILERFLRTGDLIIESAGEDGRQHFTDVANPAHVQNLIYKIVERDERRGTHPNNDGLGDRNPDPRRQHHNLTVPEQIEKLAQLHRDGALSDEEFRRSKQHLLDGM